MHREGRHSLLPPFIGSRYRLSQRSSRSRPAPRLNPLVRISRDVDAGGGEIEGRVTRAEWREHHLHVSALIADDEVFCEHVERVWGRCSRAGANRESSSDNGHSANVNSFIGSLPGNTNGISSSIRGPDDVSAGAEASNDGTTTLDGNVDEKITPRPERSSTPREAWGPSPTPAALPASSTERAPILRRSNERSGTATGLTVPPGVLGLLERVRGRLATRGMRAAFQLLKGFREEDRKGSGQVSLAGFKKAVGEAALGLKEAEMRIVFQVCCPAAVWRGGVHATRKTEYPAFCSRSRLENRACCWRGMFDGLCSGVFNCRRHIGYYISRRVHPMLCAWYLTKNYSTAYTLPYLFHNFLGESRMAIADKLGGRMLVLLYFVDGGNREMWGLLPVALFFTAWA